MKKFLFLLLGYIIFKPAIFGQLNKVPYPIIFVHGLKSSDQTFKTTMDYLNEHYKLGPINVYDVVLNADNDDETAILAEDVKWEDFEYGGRYINVGRRSYADDIDDAEDGWVQSNIFAINFQEERIRGAAGFWNDYFDYSDQAAIYKQGYALAQMIKEVLEFTGADKVVLVGHSMGGMAIREYLQRADYSHTHINWVDPYDEYGHKVAKVITIGTPHLGSNTGLDPTKSSLLNEKTEAVRDLKWEYDSYTNCNSAPVGIYLFGGNENCIASTDDNTTFYNNDINCNGSTTDNIIGVNFYTYDNPAMPLPENIPYMWVTSIWGEWDGLVGDGAVEISRQWLRVDTMPAPLGIADTMLTDVFHTSEPDDYYTIIRALDVPSRLDFAYELKIDKAFVDGVFTAGKTGTAHIAKNGVYISSFQHHLFGQVFHL
jgi:triacylglycerol esterase/lipase EstA (alpha/beta hydrolase family)